MAQVGFTFGDEAQAALAITMQPKNRVSAVVQERLLTFGLFKR
jgi:hypothetical protein